MNRFWTAPHWGTVEQAKEGTPAVLHAHSRDLIPFVDWVVEHRDEVVEQMQTAGAVLVRGVHAGTPERFERVVRAVEPDLKNDYLGTSPRDAVTDHVFEASGLPGFYPIPQHCEMTFVKSPPKRLFFGCTRAPGRFGETPIVDFRKVWRDLDPDVRERFDTRGVRIVRNYAAPGRSGGLFQLKPWPDMFGTTDREVVTARCEDEGFEVTWSDDGALRLVSHHPASTVQPSTGQRLWFNHSQVFHLGAAPGEYRRILALRPTLQHLGSLMLASTLVTMRRGQDPMTHPMHCLYDDGSPIPEADMEAVRDAIWRHMVRIPWQVGDVLAIDNYAVSHGRMPYRGPRTVIVAWA